MRKWLIYISLLLIFLPCKEVVASKKANDWSYNLKKNSTEPFGCFLASNRLIDLFAAAKVDLSLNLFKDLEKQNNKPYYRQDKQLAVMVVNGFDPTQDEVDILYEYIQNGGHVFLAAASTNAAFDSVFKSNIITAPVGKDSLLLFDMKLLTQDSVANFRMKYPFHFTYLDTFLGKVIGRQVIEEKREPIVTKQNIGKGTLVFCTAPEVLTNYFLLKRNNIEYYEMLFSHFDPSIPKISWYSQKDYNGEYERTKPQSNLWNLLKEPAYKNAFLVLLAMLLLYLLFESKRRQRLVEIVPPVSNDSLAFTETMGKLYYGEKDNENLARKMIQYYLEYIRTTYSIPTTHLDKEFANKLARKLNIPADEMQEFVNYLNQQLTAYSLTDEEIKKLYNTLKKYN